MPVRILADGPTLGAVSVALTVTFAAFAFVGIVAAAFTIVRSSNVRQNLELLRGEVSDLTAAKARVDGERDVLTASLEAARQREEILRDLATSRPDVEALIHEIRTMVRTVERGYRGVATAVSEHHGHAQPASEP